MVTSSPKLCLAAHTSVKDDLYLALTAEKLNFFAGHSRADWSGQARIAVAGRLGDADEKCCESFGIFVGV